MKRKVTKLFWVLLASSSLVFGVSLSAGAVTLPAEASPMHCGGCGVGGDDDHDKDKDKDKDGKKKKDKKKKDKKPE